LNWPVAVTSNRQIAIDSVADTARFNSNLSELGFQQLHQSPQHPVRWGGNAQRLAAPHDQAVEVIDLGALATRQVLRGGRILVGHAGGKFVHRRVHIRWYPYPLGLGHGQALGHHVAHPLNLEWA